MSPDRMSNELYCNVICFHLMLGGHLLLFDRDSRFNASWTRSQNQRAETLSFSLKFDSLKMSNELYFEKKTTLLSVKLPFMLSVS